MISIVAGACSDNAPSANRDEAIGNDTSVAATIQLEVSPNGLQLTTSEGDSASVEFGTIEGDIIGEFSALLGEPRSSSRLRECSPTAEVVIYEGLAISLSDGIFVGWALQPAATERIATTGGLHLGSTRQELEAEFGDVTTSRTATSLVEFRTAASVGLFGTLSSAEPGARLESLSAGQTCKSV